ncbi:MAG: hypothetical protein NVS3B19_18220 [Ginsengibacter sp.]
MIERPMILMLADDDDDDRMFFQEALNELPLSTKLTLLSDGDELMQLLNKSDRPLPHALFLDINMPKKSGIECLKEMRKTDRLKNLPVIMFSTAFERELVNSLYESGVKYYIRKPANFTELVNVIEKALSLIDYEIIEQPSPAEFVINSK